MLRLAEWIKKHDSTIFYKRKLLNPKKRQVECKRIRKLFYINNNQNIGHQTKYTLSQNLLEEKKNIAYY
jgi:hypothetical protein